MKKRTFQKIIASGMICCCLTAGLGSLAYASEIPDSPDDGIEAHLEETEWYYRNYNGHWQRRLWSITRGIWLTEWEYV